MNKKSPFSAVEKWIENRTFRAFGKVSRSSGRKRLFLPLLLFPAIWRLDMPDRPFTFHAKKGPIPALIKKSTMCNKGAIDFFRLVWWFWALVYHSGARGAPQCTIVMKFVRKSNNFWTKWSKKTIQVAFGS